MLFELDFFLLVKAIEVQFGRIVDQIAERTKALINAEERIPECQISVSDQC